MATSRSLNPVPAKAYAEAGITALKKYGVHHLSRSSADNLLECASKFILKNQYQTANLKLTLGSICHSVVEEAVNRLSVYSENFRNLDKDAFRQWMNEYPVFRQETLAHLDIPRILNDAADKALGDIANSSREVLYADGDDFLSFSADIREKTETLGKSLTQEHLAAVLDLPVLGAELTVTYIPEKFGDAPVIPYLGYIDILKIGPDGRLIVSDLKTTFSPNQAIWSSKMTKFQLWLYAKSLVQMGYTTELPKVDITRITADLGLKRKTKPSVYKITVERGTIEDIGTYDGKFRDVIAFAQSMIQNRIQIFAHSQYGCASCEYRNICGQAVTPEDWTITTIGGTDEPERTI